MSFYAQSIFIYAYNRQSDKHQNTVCTEVKNQQICDIDRIFLLWDIFRNEFLLFYKPESVEEEFKYLWLNK